MEARKNARKLLASTLLLLVALVSAPAVVGYSATLTPAPPTPTFGTGTQVFIPGMTTATPKSYQCPLLTPIGWGTVTPGSNWLSVCGACITPLPTGTLDYRVWTLAAQGTMYTPTPTGTTAPGSSPTPTKTPTVPFGGNSYITGVASGGHTFYNDNTPIVDWTYINTGGDHTDSMVVHNGSGSAHAFTWYGWYMVNVSWTGVNDFGNGLQFTVTVGTYNSGPVLLCSAGSSCGAGSKSVLIGPTTQTTASINNGSNSANQSWFTDVATGTGGSPLGGTFTWNNSGRWTLFSFANVTPTPTPITATPIGSGCEAVAGEQDTSWASIPQLIYVDPGVVWCLVVDPVDIGGTIDGWLAWIGLSAPSWIADVALPGLTICWQRYTIAEFDIFGVRLSLAYWVALIEGLYILSLLTHK